MANLKMVALTAMVALAGCANLDSIYRPLDLGVGVSAVSLDVKQRAIISRNKTVKNGNTITSTPVTCAEPSPDALSAYAASGGLTTAIKSAAQKSAEAQAQLAISLSESSAFVGLRTQSIQLLRDGLFADCLAYMNGSISQAEFFELRRRNQSITLGLLAIEQLTGAIKANQAALSTSADAATGADSEKQIAALDAAKERQNDAIAEQSKAANALKVANDAFAAQTKAVADLAAKPALTGSDAAAKTAAQEALKAGKDDLASKKDAASTAKIDSEKADRAAKNADDAVVVAEKTLQEAERRVRSASAASAKLTENGGQAAIIGSEVAVAVTSIVRNVLKTSSGRESNCFYLLSQIPTMTGDKQPEFFEKVYTNICTKAEQAELTETACKVAAKTDAEKAKCESPVSVKASSGSATSEAPPPPAKSAAAESSKKGSGTKSSLTQPANPPPTTDPAPVVNPTPPTAANAPPPNERIQQFLLRQSRPLYFPVE